MTDAAIEAARRALAGGRGLDDVVAPLRAAGLESIMLIKALREVTDLDLQGLVAVVEATKDGRSLAHLTPDRLPLLGRALRAGGWWTHHYRHAQIDDNPWLTLIPGSTGELGSVYFWSLPDLPPTADLWIAELIGPTTPEQRVAFRHRLEREPDLLKTHPGSRSGPGVSYESMRAELRERSADDAFWREYVELVRDTDRSLTCRFRLTPA